MCHLTQDQEPSYDIKGTLMVELLAQPFQGCDLATVVNLWCISGRYQLLETNLGLTHANAPANGGFPI
jgi:hypothetical protein